MPERFGCYLYFKQGMTPVTICLYVAFSYEAAQSWLDERTFQQTKKRGAFIKQIR